MRDHRHREFGLSDLLQPESYGPWPGNVARVQLSVGTDGAVTPAVLAGVYLVTAEGLAGTVGKVRAALMVRAADPESGMGVVQVHVIADQPAAGCGNGWRRGCAPGAPRSGRVPAPPGAVRARSSSTGSPRRPGPRRCKG